MCSFCCSAIYILIKRLWALRSDKPGNSLENFRVKHSWIITIGNNFFPPQIFSLWFYFLGITQKVSS